MHKRITLDYMNMNDNETQQRTQRLSLAGWITIVILVVLLGGACIYAVRAWNALGGVGISGAGWFFLGLGVVVTTVVGGGLMWLVFYSSRKHYDR